MAHDGYEEFDANGTRMAMRLRQSLYAFVKARTTGYIYQESAYIKTLHVDGGLLLGEDSRIFDEINGEHMGSSSLIEMGDVSLILGMAVTRDREK